MFQLNSGVKSTEEDERLQTKSDTRAVCLTCCDIEMEKGELLILINVPSRITREPVRTVNVSLEAERGRPHGIRQAENSVRGNPDAYTV